MSSVFQMNKNYSSILNKRTLVVVGVTVTGLATTYIAYRYLRGGKKGNDENENQSDDVNEEDLYPNDLALRYKEKGNKLFKNGQYREAIVFYEKAIDLADDLEDCDKMRAIFHQNIAACAEQLNDEETVLEHCTKALKLNVEYGKAYLRKSRALAKQAKFKDALFNSTVAALLEKFSSPSTLTEADGYLQIVVENELKQIANRSYPIIGRGLVYQYFTTCFRDIFCYPYFIIPIMENDEQTVELSQTSVTFFQHIFVDDLCLIRNDYLAGAFCDAEEVSAIIQRLNSFIGEQEKIPDKQLPVSRNLSAALTFLGSIYFLHGQMTESRECFEKALVVGKSLENDQVMKLIKVSTLMKYSALLLQLQEFEQSFLKINEAEHVDEQNIDVYYHRTQLLLTMDNIDASSDANRKAKSLINIDKFPSDVYLEAILNAQQLMIELRKECTESTKLRIEREMGKLLKDFPNNCDIIHLMMQIHRVNGNEDKVEELTEQIQTNCRNFVNLYEIEAIMHRINNEKTDMKQVQCDIQLMLMRENNSDTLHQLNAQLLMQMNNLPAALVSLKKTIPLTRDAKDLPYIINVVTAIETQVSAIEYLQEVNVENSMDFVELQRLATMNLGRSPNASPAPMM
ncbi:hypothetical protein SNEBB_004895 [Seison nebaliae]|nr:hypothetical protein SNEBB_004895 [Seison nebaliae]